MDKEQPSASSQSDDDESLVNENISPQQSIESFQSETDNSKLETENMEVHHHPHLHHKKKWKDYLFEFLMLFLAVSGGFFVENLREHYVEKERARGLVASLITDLQKDTASINSIEYFRENQRKLRLDSFYAMLNTDPLKIDQHIYYSLMTRISELYSFSQSNGTINQLKNAGYLRYFSDNQLLDYISEYEFWVQDYKIDEGLEYHLHYDKLIELIRQNSDNNAMYKVYIENILPDGIGIKPFKPEILQSLKALMIEVMWYNNPQMEMQNNRVKNKAITLMKYLHMKYNLE